MKLSYEIADALWKVLNTNVGPSLGGGCYLFNEPVGDQKDNIIIGVLANPGTYVQSAILNVNVSVMGLNEHTPNMAKLLSIANLVQPYLEDASHSVEGSDYHLTIENDAGVYPKLDQVGKFIYNFRVNCITL